MRTTAVRVGTAVLLAALVFGVSGRSGARAQDGEGGGLLPGASSVQKPAGRGVTTCSARNALATKQCTTTCQPGQTADCVDADDGSDPTCSCSTE